MPRFAIWFHTLVPQASKPGQPTQYCCRFLLAGWVQADEPAAALALARIRYPHALRSHLAVAPLEPTNVH